MTDPSTTIIYSPIFRIKIMALFYFMYHAPYQYCHHDKQSRACNVLQLMGIYHAITIACLLSTITETLHTIFYAQSTTNNIHRAFYNQYFFVNFYAFIMFENYQNFISIYAYLEKLVVTNNCSGFKVLYIMKELYIMCLNLES